jgi:RHS repeat-associated protein
VKVLRSTADVNWLVTDQLGTPRMIFDKTGGFATVKRHDYLPFGEEISAYGGRTAAQGYVVDNIRQQFTLKERDNETGLDYFGARYYASTQGRFTSADPMMASAKLSNPQTMNRYVYVVNNPLRYIDPDGLDGEDPWSSLTRKEQLLLAPKLTTVQDGYVPNQKQLAAAGEAFNKKVIAYTADGGAVDLKQTSTNVASLKAFGAELGSNKQAWAQVDQIGEVRATGDGKVADVTFTVKNNDAFIGALKDDSRFRYRESDAGHADSFRLRTISADDPSFHVDRSGATFGAHWDPTSTFNLQSQERVMNGVLTRDPIGVIGGLAGMGSAGIQHYGGRATVEQVQKFITPSKQ